MSDVAEMVAWLRREIETDKAAAQAVTQGMAWHAKRVEGDDFFDSPFIAIYTDGYPWRETARCCLENEAEHIARHDPQDVIADCDAKLALLDLCEEADRLRNDPGPADPAHLATRVLALGEAVMAIAQGYRHREGWRAEWSR